jgi:hypothetical protein
MIERRANEERRNTDGLHCGPTGEDGTRCAPVPIQLCVFRSSRSLGTGDTWKRRDSISLILPFHRGANELRLLYP